MLLGFLMGCGLRRGELAGLEFGDVAQREGRWAIVDLVGKHGLVCTVPMPSWVFAALDKWAAAAGIRIGNSRPNWAESTLLSQSMRE